MAGSSAIDAAPRSAGLDADASRRELGAFPFDPYYCPAEFCSTDLGTAGCVSQANSTGQVAGLAAMGSGQITDDRLILLATSLPAGVPTLLLAAQSDGYLVRPNMLGPLCLGSPFLRLISLQASSRPDGTAPSWVKLRAPGGPPAEGLGVQSGETWHFQLWYRDANGGAGTNTSSAVEVTLH